MDLLTIFDRIGVVPPRTIYRSVVELSKNNQPFTLLISRGEQLHTIDNHNESNILGDPDRRGRFYHSGAVTFGLIYLPPARPAVSAV